VKPFCATLKANKISQILQPPERIGRANIEFKNHDALLVATEHGLFAYNSLATEVDSLEEPENVFLSPPTSPSFVPNETDASVEPAREEPATKQPTIKVPHSDVASRITWFQNTLVMVIERPSINSK
jgi:hypothetical protein